MKNVSISLISPLSCTLMLHITIPSSTALSSVTPLSYREQEWTGNRAEVDEKKGEKVSRKKERKSEWWCEGRSAADRLTKESWWDFQMCRCLHTANMPAPYHSFLVWNNVERDEGSEIMAQCSRSVNKGYVLDKVSCQNLRRLMGSWRNYTAVLQAGPTHVEGDGCKSKLTTLCLLTAMQCN